MKKYIYIGIAVVIILLALTLGWAIVNSKSLEKKWKEATENVKAYSQQYSTSEKNTRALKLSVEQLESSNDSILQELNSARKELKVKNSKLQSLQYVSSSFARADTITLVDTLFKDRSISIDTTLSDEWYSVRVGLSYPSTIAIKPEFKSIKNIVVSTKKETVNPPKKFFLWRWLQKKQTVLNIDVVEKNPYVKDESNRYVKIIN
jgi:predicted RND superfamily exporter protein